MGGDRQTTTENAKFEASLNLRFAESGTKRNAMQKHVNEYEGKQSREKSSVSHQGIKHQFLVMSNIIFFFGNVFRTNTF